MKTNKILLTLAGTVLTFGIFTDNARAAVISADIAIIGHYTDGSATATFPTGDAFAWLAISSIQAGEVLYFSDSSYRSETNSFILENLIRYTAPTTITAGTVMRFEAGSLPSGYVALSDTAYSSSTSVTLTPSTSGDQLVIFQDDDVSNTANFTALWAVNNSSTGWGSSSTSPTESDLYPGLTDGVNALGLGAGSGFSDEFDNVRYVGSTTGDAATILTNIRNISNWERTNSEQINYVDWVSNGVTSFDIVPEPSSVSLLGFCCLGFILRRNRK